MTKLAPLVALFVCHGAFAQAVLPLYAGDIPGSIESPDEESIRDTKELFPFLQNISRPTLTVYLPEHADAKHAAVIILPGGSYRGVSIVKEGRDVAVAFNKMGVAAFVLKYRTPSERHMRDRKEGSLQDAQQALRVVRTRANDWHIDPQRVGLIGFSAGGHLAATAATRFDDPVIVDGEKTNLRPDFLMLLYPVISLSDPLAHSPSRTNLLGESPSDETIQRYSAEQNVSALTPPTFLVHAADDKTANVANSLRFFEALEAQKIPTEMHIYPRGGHGFGLNNPTTTDRWIDRCLAWLHAEGWLASDSNP